MNNCRIYLKEISVCAFKQIVRPLSIASAVLWSQTRNKPVFFITFPTEYRTRVRIPHFTRIVKNRMMLNKLKSYSFVSAAFSLIVSLPGFKRVHKNFTPVHCSDSWCQLAGATAAGEATMTFKVLKNTNLIFRNCKELPWAIKQNHPLLVLINFPC